MIISLIIRKMTRGRVNRWALVLIADIVVSTVADLAGHHYEAMGSRGIVGNYISNVFTLLGTTLTSVIFCGYLFAMEGSRVFVRCPGSDHFRPCPVCQSVYRNHIPD